MGGGGGREVVQEVCQYPEKSQSKGFLSSVEMCTGVTIFSLGGLIIWSWKYLRYNFLLGLPVPSTLRSLGPGLRYVNSNEEVPGTRQTRDTCRALNKRT